MVPTLTSPRLILRAHTREDFDAMCALWSEPMVTQYIGGRPSTRSEVWSRLLRYFGLWHALGYGYWAVIERQSGRFIGEAGLADFKRDIEPPIREPESGWAFMPETYGQGIATESLRTILTWADDHLSTKRTQCIISPENVASIRVAEKCGYQIESETLYMSSTCLIFGRGQNGAV